jgi:hypothetical protein
VNEIHGIADDKTQASLRFVTQLRCTSLTLTLCYLFVFAALCQYKDRDRQLKATTWLEEELDKDFEAKRGGESLLIPQKSDGTKFLLSDLGEDQRGIVGYVLARLHTWIKTIEDVNSNVDDLKPLRLTIVGAATARRIQTNRRRCYTVGRRILWD